MRKLELVLAVIGAGVVGITIFGVVYAAREMSACQDEWSTES